MEWVFAHRGEFALGEEALAPDDEVNLSWKPLGELAVTCAAVSRHTAPCDPLHARAAELLSFAWQQTGQGELFLRMQCLEPFATYPLEVYAALASAADVRHAGYEDAAAVLTRTRGWQLTEQEPTRRLAVLNAEERAGVRRPDGRAQALARTWLGGLPEPWTFERHAGYAVTHVVFHLTDWGRAGPRSVPPDLAAYLDDWLPPWLDTCLDARMWDLASELLAVAATLPKRPEPDVLQDAWERIAAAQRPSGAIPTVGQSGQHTEAEDFLGHYHTTLMALFAAALTAGRLDDGQPAPDPRHRPERHDGQGVLG
ncbi:DUF6895 family protein [Streptomyces sp. NPDC007984]|uniref:DUF6895 family protein n=1 Tax=Streptomyces sp. NPDC007984 TaxID=3364801 RepID=UPI0036E66797